MSERDAFTGRIGFLLATVASAVGLGSIWKFPYEVGANGGSAFVLFYLAGLILVVIPLMLAEFAIGRRGRGDPVSSIATVARAHGAASLWRLAGALGVATGFLILSFYSVIGGWTMAYAIDVVVSGLPGATPQAVRARFEAMLASPATLSVYHGLFMALTALVVARGVAGGIEAAAKVLMPLLVALLFALAAYAVIVGDLAGAFKYLFQLDPAKLTARAALEALGLGFFSIGVGLGLMITYAAYAGADINLKGVAFASVAADTGISLLSGFAVFPIVFAHGLDPASGPGLVFVTLPIAFAAMPFGTLAAGAFFVLLFAAALASAISMLELPVALLVRRFGWTRPAAAATAALLCFAVGLATVFSFNVWSNWFPLSAWRGFERATLFDCLDYITSNVLLPLSGWLLSLFAGFAVPAALIGAELRLGPRGTAALRGLLRYVVPFGIAATALAPLALK